MKKSVSFDDMEGGAITSSKSFETGVPVTDFRNIRTEGFRTVIDDEYSSFERPENRYDHYYNALNMNPRNIFPMFQYESSMQGENPAFVKNILLKGLSGFGSHKDPPHIQKAVVHSLKAYPHLLRMYLNSSQLIM